MSRDRLVENFTEFESKSVNLSENRSKENCGKSILKVLTEEKNLSIEICPNLELNTELLKKLNTTFCAVPWLGRPSMKNPKEIPAIKLSKDLMENGYNVMLHLPGRNFNKETIKNVLEEAKVIGIRNIFALQGDWHNVEEKDDTKCDFPYASDLVLFIKKNYGNLFCIGVAGYPDGHPHSISKETDLMYLKKKVDIGADFIITQGIFDYSTLECFIKRCRNLKIEVPILPGIFIANSFKSLIAIKNICQVNIPHKVMKSFEILQEDADVTADFGVIFVVNLIREIFEGKLCSSVHIFSLNNLKVVENIVKQLENS